MGPTGLPVEEVVADVRAALAATGTCVLQAAPGAGKTTVVPLRLLDAPAVVEGRVVVLEPRRVAARAAAARMAALVGGSVGGVVGVTTRDHRRTGPSTVVEVVTEGVLTRRLQHDPSLPGVGAVVFDEWHERHLVADLGLALTLDARAGLRPDLRVLVMSATLDTGPLAALLGGAPVVRSAGRSHPVTVEWSPAADGRPTARDVAAAVRAALDGGAGDVLAFVPGRREIGDTVAALGRPAGVDVLGLHGGLPPAAQDRALRAGDRRRVVVSTDLAESSVTVDGVTAVVDAGLVRRPVVDVATGLPRLRTGLASQAAADQRAGRAGRLAPGRAIRLWAEATHPARPAWPQPEIATADLADLALQLAVWGAAPGDLAWTDPPPPAALAAAAELLGELGALDAGGRPTTLGRRLADLPLHPRLGAVVLAAPPAARRAAARLAALLAEPVPPGATADVADRLAGADADLERRAADLLRRAGLHTPPGASPGAAVDPGPLLAAGYPDRLAQARGGGRFRLRAGGGAAVAATDPLAAASWLVAPDVEGGAGGPGRADGRIRLAAALDRADVEGAVAGRVEAVDTLVWDDAAGDLRRVVERRAGALVLERSTTRPRPGPATTAALVARAVATGLADLRWTAAARTLQRRATWAHRTAGDGWPAVDDAALAARAGEWLAPALAGATGAADLAGVDPAAGITALLAGRARQLDSVAPPAVTLAGGRRVPVDWSGDEPVVSVRAQDLYGTTVHPHAGGRPVVVEVLSPAGRPLQRTADLPGFWAGSWRDVRKEMAGRYPRHHWPADPGTAEPRRPRPGGGR
ncbi:MAG TPA: ATP-dependent helicase HrpB [Acidimicrobiales bacterium]|nr:ATP-dependent helicase HrpB [Acidimicrobiales bacterium]